MVVFGWIVSAFGFSGLAMAVAAHWLHSMLSISGMDSSHLGVIGLGVPGHVI